MSERGAPIYGMLGEFRSAEEVVGAARRLKSNGFTRWDVYGPAPIDEIDEIVPTRRGLYVTIIMAFAAVTGAALGYFIQYWDAVVNYPINVGGRPYNSWPGFVPVAWEVCALFTVFFGYFAFLLFCRLPRLHHPIFTVPGFERATQDRFFVCVETGDKHYEAERIRWIFERYGALRVSEITE